MKIRSNLARVPKARHYSVEQVLAWSLADQLSVPVANLGFAAMLLADLANMTVAHYRCQPFYPCTSCRSL